MGMVEWEWVYCIGYIDYGRLFVWSLDLAQSFTCSATGFEAC
jgi:hypothetical protein